jgi:hypothetical protein
MDRYITETFDIVYAYGVLYHLADPQAALEAMARRCGDLLLLETCVSFGANEAINPEPEPQSSASQSFQGMGCRPTRPWVFSRLTSTRRRRSPRTRNFRSTGQRRPRAVVSIGLSSSPHAAHCPNRFCSIICRTGKRQLELGGRALDYTAALPAPRTPVLAVGSTGR